MAQPVELAGRHLGRPRRSDVRHNHWRDVTNRLWISPLTGSPGFLRVTSPTTVEVYARPSHGDPLDGLPVGQSVGLVVMEFAARRRVRINGIFTRVGSDYLVVAVEQA
jgi:hypothetical protein